MRVRRGAVLAAVLGAALTIVIGGADAIAEPASERACADTTSFMASAALDPGATVVSFRVVRCSG